MRMQKLSFRMFKYYLLRLIRVKDNRFRVQRGVALGIAIHSIPLFGFTLFVALGLSFPLRANKLAITIANLMSAPLTIPIYGLDALTVKLLKNSLQIPYKFAFPLGVMLTFVCLGAISYFFAEIIMKQIRNLLERKRAERRMPNRSSS